VLFEQFWLEKGPAPRPDATTADGEAPLLLLVACRRAVNAVLRHVHRLHDFGQHHLFNHRASERQYVSQQIENNIACI